MDLEVPATKYAPAHLSQFKEEYSDFVSATVKILRDRGYKEPKGKNELLRLCEEIGSILWSNFDRAETDLLLDGFSKKKGGKLGTLDCDTSSFVFADILNQFNVNSKLVSLPGHVLIRLETTKGSVYFETTNISCHESYYHSSDGFKMRYPISFGESDFQAENSSTYYNRSVAKKNQGDFAGAIEDSTKVIELNREKAGAYDVRGVAKLYIGDYKGAIEDLNEAIKLDPKAAIFYVGRSAVKEKQRDFAGAIEDLYTAIKLDPEFAVAYVFLAIIRTDELGDHKGAIKDYSKAIKLDPNNAIAHYDRGVAEVRLGNFVSAKQDFVNAIELNPKYKEAYNNRGFAKKKLGDLKGAKSDYEMADKLESADKK